MIILPWIEKVGHAFICSSEHVVILSCSSPIVLSAFMKERFDPKKHSAALLLRYVDSRYVFIMMNPEDVPISNVYDPHNGKAVILYEENNSENALARIE